MCILASVSTFELTNREKAERDAERLSQYGSESELFDIGDMDYWSDPEIPVRFEEFTDQYGYRATVFGDDKHAEFKMYKHGVEVESKMYKSFAAAKRTMGKISDTWSPVTC